jgi:hypothetical protein
MARRKKRRSGYQRLMKKSAKCPGTVRRICKLVPSKRNRRTGRINKGGQMCRVKAGRYTSKWTSAGQALRSAIKLRTRLQKKGCAIGAGGVSLGRYRRRRR